MDRDETVEQPSKDSFELFVEHIVADKGLPVADDEVRQQLVQDLKARLGDQINRALVAALPEDKFEQLERIVNEGGEEAAIQEVIAQSGIDIKKITLETMLTFRDLYLGVASDQEHQE